MRAGREDSDRRQMNIDREIYRQTDIQTQPCHAKSLQLCPTLCCPMDCSLPGSSVHGILQVRILEWVAIFSSRRSSQCRDGARVSCTAGKFFMSHHGSSQIEEVNSTNLCVQETFLFKHHNRGTTRLNSLLEVTELLNGVETQMLLASCFMTSFL